MRLSIWIPGILGILGPIVIPISHMVVLWFYWQNYARFVDRRFCSCSCWDTVFKGTYESGIASYKHLYFNATENTMKIWILTVIAIIALYECAKHLISLMILKSVRYSMIFLFCLSIFSHYYGWWAFLNYYNDDFYSQWNHQMFFTITELLSTSVVFHLANLENIVTPRKVLSVVGIAILHIVASGFDQFIANVFKGEGLLHQIIRDLGFMIPDIFHFIIPIWLLRKSRRENYSTKPFYRDHKLKNDIVATFVIVTILLLVCLFL
ncbi:uncharacterized protein LOC129578138 isoform X2 [Sitodiplosis mosellana]|uniref:uncharacterized protein LOC129578138 isoform X2 n=1 Tax=Sitodiplosis mosellana TaxID=263140 RepID=UPI0024448964|nr:uncharacterized protein LOC129578138 isoform X2 [Sitodiplosis mosellana]